MKTIILQITPPINSNYGSPFDLTTNGTPSGSVTPLTATTAELIAGISIEVEDDATEVYLSNYTGLCPAAITVPIIYPCYCTQLTNLLGTLQTFDYTDCSNISVVGERIEANESIRICGILANNFDITYPDIQIDNVTNQCIPNEDPSKPIFCGNKPSTCYRIYKSPTATTTSYSCWIANQYITTSISANQVFEVCIETGTLVSGDLIVQTLSNTCTTESCHYDTHCHTITATSGNLVYEYIQGNEKFINNTLLSGGTAKICAKVGTIIKTSGTGTLTVVDNNYSCNNNGTCEIPYGCLTVTNTDVRLPATNYYISIDYVNNNNGFSNYVEIYPGESITDCVRGGSLVITPNLGATHSTVVHNENCSLAAECSVPLSYCVSFIVTTPVHLQWLNSNGDLIDRTYTSYYEGYTCVRFGSFQVLSGSLGYIDYTGNRCSADLSGSCPDAIP